MGSIQDQTIALAGILQSVALVESLAKTGSADKVPLQTTINSVFVTNPKDTIAVFGDLVGLELGLKVLLEHLDGRGSNSAPESLRYALSLLHLEKRLRKNPAMLSVISQRLQRCEQQLQHFDVSHENIVANLADIYSDTISTFSFRIQVRGNFDNLQQPRIANQIRALLLAGIRATILWRQLGGSRINLFWHRAKIRDCTRELNRQISPFNR